MIHELGGAGVGHIPDRRGAVEYQESGQGAPVLFVPGSFSTGASWRGISTVLAERYRTITTSLLGYGKTHERRHPTDTNIQDEIDVLDAVLSQVEEPVHLVAHSFGAYVALHLAACRSPRLLSLTLLEPIVFNLLASDRDAELYRQVDAMTDLYMAEWQGGNRQAIRHVIDFYGGAGTFGAYPDSLQEKFITHTPTNILDWQTFYSSSFTSGELSQMTIPALIVCGDSSNSAMKRCNELLVQHLPRADLRTLDGANHFMIGTHPKQITALIENHIHTCGGLEAP